MAKKRANGEGNIRKRKDGRWEGRFTAGHDPSTGKQVIKSIRGQTEKVVFIQEWGCHFMSVLQVRVLLSHTLTQKLNSNTEFSLFSILPHHLLLESISIKLFHSWTNVKECALTTSLHFNHKSRQDNGSKTKKCKLLQTSPIKVLGQQRKLKAGLG